MKILRILLGLFIGLLLLILVGPFLIPIKTLDGLLPPEELADTDSKFIEVDGLQAKEGSD